ncbi:MAG: RIO1 family regulatory kinase/ATPase [Acidimicrobiales bacterium]
MAASRSAKRRQRFDDDGWEPSVPSITDEHLVDDIDHIDHATDPDAFADGFEDEPDDEPDEPAWSTYRDATKGPTPVPAWVVTDPRAVDVDHGVLKTGKEADVSLLERSVDPALGRPERGAAHGWLAVKRYRSAEHRMFHRDAGYLEGRRVRKSREMRAMATRTDFGRELIAGQWAAAEFGVLSRLWQAGASVPYPVQLIGTELMMEFVGHDGVAAPRLAQIRPDRAEARDLYDQMREVLRQLADAGYAHGDLSPYNTLVHDGRIVLIDLPQAVDLVGNPQGFAYLRRDCENICGWFAAHNAPHADAWELEQDLLRSVPGLG